MPTHPAALVEEVGVLCEPQSAVAASVWLAANFPGRSYQIFAPI